ncbi:hypothetical protein Golax_022596, partial [Gossypium laxum]|nr:hypothetical protein [Gossypium laxum]
MMELYCQKSHLKDGQTVLDVGCGWGSLSLHCPDGQLQNVKIIVADISTFEMEASYDRIYSIGMF